MLLTLIMAFSFLVSAHPEWNWSVHPESGFKILSPVEFIHNTTEIPTISDPIVYHQYKGGSLSEPVNIVFVIDHYAMGDHPEDQDAGYLEEFFTTTIDQILEAVDGNLIYSDISGYSDRNVCIWKATYQEGKGIIKGQLILTREKYYGLQAFGLEEKKPDEMMQKFLDSFQLINQ